MKEDRKPSFLVTSSLLWKDPMPFLFSLSLVKTSQRNLVDSLKRTYPGEFVPLYSSFEPTFLACRMQKVYTKNENLTKK